MKTFTDGLPWTSLVTAILMSASVSFANSRMLFTLGEELVDVLGEGDDEVGDGIEALVERASSGEIGDVNEAGECEAPEIKATFSDELAGASQATSCPVGPPRSRKSPTSNEAPTCEASEIKTTFADEALGAKVESFVKPPLRDRVRRQLGIEICPDELLRAINSADPEAIVGKKVERRPCLNLFTQISAQDNLCPITTRNPELNIAIDPSKWEELVAIIDSGATVPVFHPKVGKAYELEESEASKAGVEYEIASGDTLANLGQKRLAVLTAEGTVRGYQSQCADVSKSLQSVRACLESGHAVCFGLGPNGLDKPLINRHSGEVNRIEDDGVNYLQRLKIIPPDQIEAVQELLSQFDGDGSAQGFTGRGR